ncbi:MAG: alpha/beta hydrolase [Gemmatimonadales bacterium]
MSLALAAIALFLASWIVLPPPIYPLLLLAVGAPEVSIWLLGLAVLAGGLALPDVRGSSAARISTGLAALTIVLAAIPLVQFGGVARRFDLAMRSALGEHYLAEIRAPVRREMRQRPLVVADLVRGIDPAAARVTRGVLFATHDGVPLTLDIYRPLKSGQSPTVVQVYGGAWQTGTPSADGAFARYLAAHGYVVFAIDYRHAPRWQWPAQLTDVQAALAWVRVNGARYGADPARLALVGRSSGAQLVMAAAYGSAAPNVRAVVSYYGPVDLTEGYRHPPRPDPLHVRGVEEAFLGGTPETQPLRYRAASPITYVTRPLPPTLLIYAGRDHIVEPRFGALLQRRLRATGTTSILLEIPWAEHGFDAIANGPSAQLALFETERFLAWALHP